MTLINSIHLIFSQHLRGHMESNFGLMVHRHVDHMVNSFGCMVHHHLDHMVNNFGCMAHHHLDILAIIECIMVHHHVDHMENNFGCMDHHHLDHMENSFGCMVHHHLDFMVSILFIMECIMDYHLFFIMVNIIMDIINLYKIIKSNIKLILKTKVLDTSSVIRLGDHRWAGA